MSFWKIAYTCDDLGACQSRTPLCAGCAAAQLRHDLPTPTFPFAPGVIEVCPKPPSPTLTKWLVRWVWFTAAVSLVCFAAGLLP